MTFLLHTILHYLRLCWNCISSFFFVGHSHSNSHHGAAPRNGGGISSLSSLFHRVTSPNQTLTFDNGLQVEIGRQIAEGGFSYVFEAFPVGHINVTGTGTVVAAPPGTTSTSAISSSNGRVMLSQRSSSSSSTNMTESTTDSITIVRHNHQHHHNHNHIKKYALKRINCSNHHEIVQSCRHEAGIHRSLPSLHPNLLELLGLKFDNNSDSTTTTTSNDNNDNGNRMMMIHNNEYNVCYMLFPYIPYSLRGEITNRNIILSNNNDSESSRSSTRRRPFATKEILQLFGGLIDALTAMHNANISHRDVKLENVLLEIMNIGYDGDDTVASHSHNNNVNVNQSNTSSGSRSSRRRFTYTPILMDFGSAGPLTTTQLHSRQDILTIIENAASHTTMPYRPPELFEGGITTRHNNGSGKKKNNNNREMVMYLDYGKVDVWSLGCVLFGLMHGTSPFEMEFVRGTNDRNRNSIINNPHPQQQQQQQQLFGLVRVVECTNLKILGEVPLPPWATNANQGGGETINNHHHQGPDIERNNNGKYPLSIYKFVRYMVNHDRVKRPNIHEVAKRFGELYLEVLGERWISYEEEGRHGADSITGNKGRDYDDFDSLIASRDFV